MEITPQMIEALDRLREFARAVGRENYPHVLDREAADAVELLDNADFFAALDDAREDGPDSGRPCGCGGVGVHGVDHRD